MYQAIPDGGRTAIELNPYRELAAAIRAGCQTTKKSRLGGYFWLENQACALGAAMIALDLAERIPGAIGWKAGLGEDLLFARFPILRERVAGRLLYRLIIGMNDHSEMSREKIADLIEALGNKKARRKAIRAIASRKKRLSAAAAPAEARRHWR